MLEILQYSSLGEKNKFLQQLDFSQSTLIIPDLSSKLYWQSYHFKKTGLPLDSQVLRAEDFWKDLLQKTHPDIRVVSRSWMSTYLKQVLNQDLLISVGLPHAKTNTVLKAITEFLPILSHPESQEIMKYWFEEVQAGQCSWKKWFDLSVILWELIASPNLKEGSGEAPPTPSKMIPKLLQEQSDEHNGASTIFETPAGKRQILSEWSSSFLVQSQNFESLWQGNLIVDLGPELRTIEVELIQSLASVNSVQVLTPHPQWIEDFRWIAYPYKQFSSRSHKVISLSDVSGHKLKEEENSMPIAPQSFFKRFASTLGEVKFVISQIHEWLNAGYALSEIAVIAPDIEDYWPVLSVHFNKESLLFEKSEKAQIGSIGSVVAWLAYLKKQTYSPLSFAELQLAEFHPLNKKTNPTLVDQNSAATISEVSEDSGMRYESLQTLWTHKPYPNPLTLESQNKVVSAAFMAWALKVWPQASFMPSLLLEFCQKWVLETESLGSLSAAEWIECLEDYLNTQENELVPGTANTIGVYSLMNGIPAHKKLQIFLGCSESQLKSHRGLVSGAEVLSLQHHTGHLLAHPDRDFREFQLRALWGEGREQYFTFPETNFSAENLVPSVFWMKGREKEINKKNLYSSISFHHLDSWTPGHWEQELINSTAEIATEQKIPHALPFSLSPASLKTYVECPFKFFAEKGLKLNIPVVVDLDLDPRTQGSLQHKLLELLTEEPFDPVLRRTQMKDLIEKALESQKDQYYSEKTKELIRHQLLRLAKGFLDHEEVYRKEFPRFYTLAREAWFQRSVDVGHSKVNFRGKIDRIDMSVDGTEAIVVDYKNDIKSYSHAPSWMKNLEFQMPAYTQGVEGGAAKTEAGAAIAPTPVVAAHYYGLRDFSRKGFTLDEASSGVVAPLSATGTLTSAEKSQMIEEFQQILTTSAQKILEGDFRAIPHPQTDCNNCSWRSLCRTRQPNL